MTICRFASLFMLIVVIHVVYSDVECQDKQSACEDDTTCCLMESGEYGCCPMPNAVCCTDKIHCCPQGTACDLKQATCINGDGDFVASMAANGPISNKLKQGSPCICSSSETCCPAQSGQMGCCPLTNATCCADKLHCCPEGSKCDSQGQCFSSSNNSSGLLVSIPWSKKFKAKSYSNYENNIPCGDHKTKCPDQTTCCQLASGKWGCCPMPNAVCCTDGVHCCPENTICDLDEGRCVTQGQSSTTSTTFVALKKIGQELHQWTQPCGIEGLFKCPDRATCCKLRNGKWGCCPMSQAVCCSDGQHCCPHNTHCDIQQRFCIENDIRRYFSVNGIGGIKMTAINVGSQFVVRV